MTNDVGAKYSKSELIARSRTVRVRTALAIGGGATAIISGIPAGRRVCIWKITGTVGGVGAGAECLQVSSCATGGAAETNVLAQYGFGTIGPDTIDIGGDVESPVIIEQNQTPASGASSHVDIGVSHLAAPIDVTMTYYLLP